MRIEYGGFFTSKKVHVYDLYFYVKSGRAIEFFTKTDITDIVGTDFSDFYYSAAPSNMDPASFAKAVSAPDRAERSMRIQAFREGVAEYRRQKEASERAWERERKERETSLEWLKRNIP